MCTWRTVSAGLPGHGHTDFLDAFRALREIEFDGWLALECLPTPGNPLENMRACVEDLRALLG